MPVNMRLGKKKSEARKKGSKKKGEVKAKVVW